MTETQRMDPESVAVERAIAQCIDMAGALLPMLHAIQDALGYVPESAVPRLASALNISRAEVHGVISFYHDFRTTPPGKHVLRICRAEACQSMGSQALEAHVKRQLGCDYHETSKDGSCTLEPVYCLGNCAAAPSVLIDGTLHARVTPQKFDELAKTELARAAKCPAPHAAAAPTATAAATATATASTATRIVYVPLDAAAKAAGADDVAAAFASDPRVKVVRTGSRGLLWAEPLVEIQGANGGARIAYGNVTASDVPSLLAASTDAEHPRKLGPVEEHAYFKRQDRLTFARCGVIDPLDLDAYAAHGGLRGLDNALAKSPADIVAIVTESGLRGRGGAAFPTGIKWKTVLETPAAQKYIVCNADEGDSGTFSDRMIMEGDPFVLIEGMLIAGLAVGATRGFVYLRSEYPDAERVLLRALDVARTRGLLGDSVRGSKRAFHLELRRGAGSYVCGEETALLESLEGKRGVVRYRPPVPAVKGLFQQPTALNNVNTFASVPIILDKGASYYKDFGVGRSRGTVAFQIAGNVKRGGLVEKAFGLTLRELIEDYGGGTASGRPIRAVQVGGPLGAYLPAAALDTPLDYEALAAKQGLLGHGGVVVFDDTVDMAQQARFAMEFCAIESCGKCTPCRIGSTRGVELIDKLTRSKQPGLEEAVLHDLCETMTHASLCALGGLTPLPVQSALRHFPEDFARRR